LWPSFETAALRPPQDEVVTRGTQSGPGWMGTDLDVVLLGQTHRLAHVIETGPMESARNVGERDERHERLVVAHSIKAERLAHVAIDRRHGVKLRRRYGEFELRLSLASSE
jgi:hypothetical protein